MGKKRSASPAHTLDHRRRLKDKLRAAGPDAFADYEFLELLLTYAIPRIDVKPLAKALMARFGGLKGVLDAAPADVISVAGAGPQTAAFLTALRGLMRRYFALRAMETDLLNSPDAVLAYCRASLENEKNEVFEILHLSAKNRLIKAERLSEGTLDRTAVFPRRVVESALAHRAAAVILVHNHPSGDPTPSPEDVSLTRELIRAARALDIAVHDHIVVGNGRSVSFREKGILPTG